MCHFVFWYHFENTEFSVHSWFDLFRTIGFKFTLESFEHLSSNSFETFYSDSFWILRFNTLNPVFKFIWNLLFRFLLNPPVQYFEPRLQIILKPHIQIPFESSGSIFWTPSSNYFEDSDSDSFWIFRFNILKHRLQIILQPRFIYYESSTFQIMDSDFKSDNFIPPHLNYQT